MEGNDQNLLNHEGRFRASQASGGQRAASEESGLLEDDEDTHTAEGWGALRRDYYNADVIETEADALEEEEEAIRLQKAQLEGMTEADFGFDETEWLQSGKEDASEDRTESEGTVRETLPQLTITDAMGPDELSQILSKRYPEFELLTKEFLALNSVYEKWHTKSSAYSALLTPSIKHRALTAYLAALSMYFAVFTSSTGDNGKRIAKASIELQNHPIMDSLFQCRLLWEQVKDLELSNIEEENRTITISAVRNLEQNTQLTVQNTDDKGSGDLKSNMKRKKRRKNQAQRAAETAVSVAQALRDERLRKTEENLLRLSTVTNSVKSPEQSSISKSNGVDIEDDSDFGEEISLTPHEAAEKSKRKRSLRFYTSQIVQKSHKRDLAGRDAGGDADLPYRERFKDKQARLLVEAEVRGKKGTDANGVALGGESDDEDYRVAMKIRDNASEHEYYDLVTARSQQKKSAKAVLATAQEQALKEVGVVHEVEQVGPDGKRGITYAIEKNKGLTPKRKKDARNPRVKKRKKYEDKMKKLGSVRPVYKGGEGRGGYGGELTGIKKGLVRSTKL